MMTANVEKSITLTQSELNALVERRLSNYRRRATREIRQEFDKEIAQLIAERDQLRADLDQLVASRLRVRVRRAITRLQMEVMKWITLTLSRKSAR